MPPMPCNATGPVPESTTFGLLRSSVRSSRRSASRPVKRLLRPGTSKTVLSRPGNRGPVGSSRSADTPSRPTRRRIRAAAVCASSPATETVCAAGTFARRRTSAT